MRYRLLDHAHHAITALFEIYFPWKMRKSIDVPARVQDIIDALWGEGGALMSLETKDHEPAWRGILPGTEDDFSRETDLVIGAAFDDLQAGFSGIAQACANVGALMNVRISEAPATGDPFAYLRPSSPQPRSAR